MKFFKFSLLAAALLMFVFHFNTATALAANSAQLKPVPINFGHDKCKRCLMKIKSKRYSAEVGNVKTGKVYKFDDIGCAVMWLYHDCHFGWKKNAKIWVTDAKTKKWLNAKTACWVDGEITPMHFGLGAYKKGETNKKCLSWKTAKQLLLKRGIKKENHMKKFMPKMWKMKAKKMCILK